jgi:MFS family permease
MFLPFDGLVPLYVVSAMFGLFQGGIVPSYAIIVREHFAPATVGAKVGAVIMCTMLGMALGGWMSGKVFDLTGSYHAAFINGIAWNLLNFVIVALLLWRSTRPQSDFLCALPLKTAAFLITPSSHSGDVLPKKIG